MQHRLARPSLVVLAALIGAAPAAADSIRFSKQTVKVGDVSRQTINCNLEADLVISQGKQLVDSSRQGLRRLQDRSLTILELQRGGRPARGRMTYHSASEVSTRQGEPPKTRDEPVAGKSYLVSRSSGKLEITDVDGNAPPADEMSVLLKNLQAFGLPNPLADFFDGKTIAVGETVSLPHDVARELLGFTGTVGNIKRFTLKLVRKQNVDGVACAVFEILVQTGGEEQGHMTLLMKGHLAMEIETCRTVDISMTGPVVVSETHGPAQAQFTVSTQGQLSVAVRSNHQQR